MMGVPERGIVIGLGRGDDVGGEVGCVGGGVAVRPGELRGGPPISSLWTRQAVFRSCVFESLLFVVMWINPV